MAKYPRNYSKLQKTFPELINAYQEAGKLARETGPINEKTSHLIQIAACAAIRSEGGVHSHTKRALKAGAVKKEVYHTIALLINTIGFPSAAAAFSWVNDVIEKKR